MKKVERLINELSQAGRCSAGVPNTEVSERVRSIVANAGRACLHESEVSTYLSRAGSLLEKFSRIFAACPEVFILRAPGRINLIGEHTDYNGLPVLPIAINRDIMLVGASRRDMTVQIHNMDARFPQCQFEISEQIEPYRQGDWGNYAKAAAQSMQQFFSDHANPLEGFNAVVGGNIPMASGLASSSALVVAFALAILLANERDVDRPTLAELLARGEQYVGTRGGGMDQTVCLMAEEGRALKIEFFPTRIERIPLPPGHSFVVCHSMVSAPKSSSARLAYNLRAAESRTAAAVLGSALARKTPSRTLTVERLGDLCSEELKLSDAEIDSYVEKTFEKKAYSLEEVAHLLGTNEQRVRQSYLGTFSDKEISLLGKLKLWSRCRHVLSEGRRVRKAAAALRAGEVREFGKLMYESHESCANDYEVSTPELDTLVTIAREAGALGSRLTGAGFGGCTISLVHRADVGKYIDLVEKRYYAGYLPGRKLKQEQKCRPADHIFVCKPVGNAGELFT